MKHKEIYEMSNERKRAVFLLIFKTSFSTLYRFMHTRSRLGIQSRNELPTEMIYTKFKSLSRFAWKFYWNERCKVRYQKIWGKDTKYIQKRGFQRYLAALGVCESSYLLNTCFEYYQLHFIIFKSIYYMNK